MCGSTATVPTAICSFANSALARSVSASSCASPRSRPTSAAAADSDPFLFSDFSRGLGLDFSKLYVVAATSSESSSRLPTFGPTTSLKPHGMIEPGLKTGSSSTSHASAPAPPPDRHPPPPPRLDGGGADDAVAVDGGDSKLEVGVEVL